MKTAFPPDFNSALGYAFSRFLELKSILTNPLAPRDGVLPVAPEDFQPTLRFVVCSDVHNQNERFRDMMRSLYQVAKADTAHPSLDAVLVAGDFTGSGKYEEMVDFKEALFDSLQEGTRPIICIGNHEYIDTVRRHHLEHGSIEEIFSSLFGLQPDQATNINGYTFLTVSYDRYGKHFRGREKRKFYQDVLNAAAKQAPEKPIFVIQHPHPYLTVYGSINWAEIGLSRFWRKKPNVVNFSGHSHYPMNDPRSIWQGSYTALGTGSLKYHEIENNLRCGYHASIPDSAEECYLVEVDANSNLKIRCYHLYSHDFFGETYYIENPSNKKEFRYTYANRFKADAPPEFPKKTFLTVTKDEKGHDHINFPAATDRFIVHDYRIVIKKKNGKKIHSKGYLSDSCLISRAPKYLSIDIGRCLKKGETYQIKIYAVNSFWQISKPLVKTVQV